MNSARTARLKHVFRIVNGATPTPEPINWDGGVAWATPVDVGKHDGQVIESTQRSISEEGLRSCAAETAPPGSLVLSTRAPIGYVAETASEMAINQGCRLLVPTRGIDPTFCRYVLSTRRSELQSLGRGSTFVELSTDDLGDLKLPLPELKEQRAIVRFLDEETSKIDALIEKNRRLLGVIDVNRRTLIRLVVTSGLSNPPMKPTGVDWMGDIPEHWRVQRLKTLARLESGHTPRRSEATYWIDCDIPWVSLNDVGRMKDVRYLDQTTNKISEKGLAASSARMLPARTVILSRDATVGRTAILAVPMATSQHFVNWLCDEDLLDPEYLYFVFKDAMQEEFDRLTMGSTLRTIGLPDVNSFTIPVPPIDEQREVARQCIRTEELAEEAGSSVKRVLSLLKEYRSALITAAVTGQMDVGSAA